MNVDPSVVAVAVLTPLGIYVLNRWIARASLRRRAQNEALPATFRVAPFYWRFVLAQVGLWLAIGAAVAVFIRPGGLYVGALFAAFAGLPALFLRELRSMTLIISEQRIQYRDTTTAWSIERSEIRQVFTTAGSIVIDVGGPRRAVMPVYIDFAATVVRMLRTPPSSPSAIAADASGRGAASDNESSPSTQQSP